MKVEARAWPMTRNLLTESTMREATPNELATNKR